MKKLILSAALFFSVVGYTQSNSTAAVMSLPINAQGFLVLNNDPALAVDHWKVDYMHKNVDANGVVTFTTFDKVIMYGRNYTKVLKDYYTIDNVYISVDGYNAGNEIIISEGPLSSNGNGDVYEVVNSWTCNGTYYAYTLKQSTNQQNGASRLSLSSGGANSSNIYQYTDNYAGLSALKTFHYLSQNDSPFDNNPGVIGIAGTAVGDYFDLGGMPLSGMVYGVSKSMGPWYQGDYSIPSDFFVSNARDNASLGFMIDYYNNNGGGADLMSDGKPLLECAAAIQGSAQWASSGAYDCIEQTGFQLGVNGSDVNDYISIIDACMGFNNSPGGGIEWVNIEYSINDLGNSGGGTTGPIINRPFGTLVNSKGDLIKNTFTLSPSLYKILVHSADGKYVEVYTDLREKLVNSLTMSDLLTTTVFPVPIKGDDFNIRLNAASNMAFRYKVTNLSGEVFSDQSFELNKDHDRVHTIKPIDGKSFPSGILVNVIEFKDGSISSFQTIKQ